MKTLKILFSMALFVFFSANQPIGAQRIEPLFDMFTDPDNPTGHPATELWVADYDPVNNHQRIMIMFDLSAYIGGDADSAFLNLDRFFGCPMGTPTNVKIYDITESWNESWPENVHISHSATEWASYSFTVDGWHRIDITLLVNSWLDETLENHGLVIQALAGSKWSKFYSREASSNFRPYLELVNYTVVEEPVNNSTMIDCIDAYPNPFYTHCRITVPQGSSIEIVSLDGRIVSRAENLQDAYTWRPSDSEKSGVYFIRAMSDRHFACKKITYLK